jgi:hypothetical protein
MRRCGDAGTWGCGKREAGSREQEAGSRKQEAESRKQKAESRKQKEIIPLGSIASRRAVSSRQSFEFLVVGFEWLLKTKNSKLKTLMVLSLRDER